VPVTDEILAGTTSLMLNDMVLGLTPGQPVALSGTQSDPPGVAGNEILFLQNITHTAGFTVLSFTTVPGFNAGLKNSYIRSSVIINANVTLATHGASVQEVLGSGDGSQTNQSFTLKRPPLTYVSAPTPSGVASSLQVRVNGLEWEESPTLYRLTASDQEYIVRLADDGTPTLTFGDPASRLKTGQQNVTATYRTGIGLAGNVAAGSLSLLQSRPPGLRGVTNPLPASGAADPQNISDARSNAPLTVLTLDRIVSLEDYQSFTQAFAGIGKAQAVALWSGETQVIQITVAAADGTPISSTDPLSQTLIQAITLAHDPVQSFVVAGFQPLTFNLTAGILIDQPTYLPSVVMAEVTSALTTAFAFAQRSFAQPVTAAEILELIQGVPGVIAVDLTQLYLTSDTTGPSQIEPPAFLPSLPARFQNNAIQPAQLLLLNPLGVTLTEMTS
jgi:predicted phage baseplate assembly protein